MTALEQSWEHGYITTNGVKLHYVAQGSGSLMLMLHGFPEFWYSWRNGLCCNQLFAILRSSLDRAL